jgi:polyisoprenoid-binding protein YceI
MFRIILMSLFAFVASAANADWYLDSDNSTISFVSVKNGLVAESHAFGNLTGSITENGQAVIEIELKSVNTTVPIRDERMRDTLFEIVSFPLATYEADVPLGDLKQLAVGEGTRLVLSGTLSLHGRDAPLNIPVTVVRARADAYHVTTEKPVIVNAATFNLADGIEALRNIAQLQAITPAVPVAFSLVFKDS